MSASNPIVRGELCWLRRFERADLAHYKAAVNEVSVSWWAGYGEPHNDAMVEQFYENRLTGDEYFFVISPLGSDDFLGTIWLWNLNGRLGGAELSMFIAAGGDRGRGLGRDAIGAVLDFGFGHLDLYRIWLTTRAENERAQRAFAAAGFAEEGRIRGHGMARGERYDSVQMSILRPDWEALDRPRGWDHWNLT